MKLVRHAGSRFAPPVLCQIHQTCISQAPDVLINEAKKFGSDRAMFLHFQRFHPKVKCFPRLEIQFHRRSRSDAGASRVSTKTDAFGFEEKLDLK